MFSDFLYEDLHKPIVEPKNFLKNIPVLKGFEKGETLYSVSFVRQYENASVIHFSIEEIYNDEMNELMRPEFTHFELSIKTEEGEHECRNEGGGGSNGSTSYSFIVSPALPEDLSKYELVFKEYKMPFNKPTGFEFIL